MCGIGRTAVYLCPDDLCSHNKFGLLVNLPKENYQCGGKGYIGPTTCANSANCWAKTPEFSQCYSKPCPSDWACGMFIFNIIY